MSGLSDEELVAKYREAGGKPNGTPFADELFQRHYAKVALWCFRIAGNRDAATDLAGVEAPALSLKVYGGTPPFTWLADGIPIAEREFRRDAFWDQPSHGFARLSVIDAKGKTASARIRVE